MQFYILFTKQRDIQFPKMVVPIDQPLLSLAAMIVGLYDEIAALKQASGPTASLKTILATGELNGYSNVYAASMIAMMAGSDFIKTSTGKETVNATLPVGVVMCQAIKDYYAKTGYKVNLYVSFCQVNSNN